MKYKLNILICWGFSAAFAYISFGYDDPVHMQTACIFACTGLILEKMEK